MAATKKRPSKLACKRRAKALPKKRSAPAGRALAACRRPAKRRSVRNGVSTTKRFVVEVWDADKRYWRTYDSWAHGESAADVRRRVMNQLPDLVADEIRVKKIPARKLAKRISSRNGSTKYAFYVVDNVTGLVHAGNEYREDAADARREMLDEGVPRDRVSVLTAAGVRRRFGAIKWGTGRPDVRAAERNGSSVRHFGDRDRNAPRSPWGKAQRVIDVQRGVRWVDTAGHGGLGVAKGVASRTLSAKTIAEGMPEGGYLWYEEDEQCSYPFAEHPEWAAAIRSADRS